MNYIEISLKSELENEILIALLSAMPFESFVDEEVLKAYISVEDFEENQFDEILQQVKALSEVEVKQKVIEDENWNSKWESNFNPVIIADRIWVGAPFHTPPDDVDYKLIIEPKMSFGTAHHQTTSLMMEWLLKIDLENKNVLDMGTGTGILAIMAEKLGANNTFAIDNDPWSYENSLENIERNDCHKIKIALGDITEVPDEKYGLIIANINRNILLKHIEGYANRMSDNADLLLSGFYKEDIPVIEAEAKKYGLVKDSFLEKDNWVAVRFRMS